MCKEFYEKWTKEFMDSWKELDWKRTLNTLSRNVEYYENPIDKPCSNFEEVTNLWNVISDNQKDISYKFEIISFNENYCYFLLKYYMRQNTFPQLSNYLYCNYYILSFFLN